MCKITKKDWMVSCYKSLSGPTELFNELLDPDTAVSRSSYLIEIWEQLCDEIISNGRGSVVRNRKDIIELFAVSEESLERLVGFVFIRERSF